MITKSATATMGATTGTRADSGLATILFVAFLGVAMVFGAGFANSAAMHGAAHDSRHSAGFPCH